MENNEGIPEVDIEDLDSQVMKLFREDQADRELLASNLTNHALEVQHRDEVRLKKARDLLTKEEITNPHALHMLSMIFQHGNSEDDIQKALDISKKAVEYGLPPAYSLIPHATDRLMLYKQQRSGIPLNDIKQKFGTQYRHDEDGNIIYYSLDGTATDEELKQFGLQQSDNHEIL